ncbi:ATP-binding protein [Streptomyces niveus]|uniref:ATP-binding protein n=1 Tax=Streptomyces niveus TaxID=193462 RepID=UPI0036F16E0F
MASFRISEYGRGEQPSPEDASRVGAMRRLARARLGYCNLTYMADEVSLIVSELVTNAIVHSNGTQVTLTLELRDGCLNIAVRSDKPGRPTVRTAKADEETGRGLYLVECLAEARNGSWGTTDDGSTTWCTLTVGSC